MEHFHLLGIKGSGMRDLAQIFEVYLCEIFGSAREKNSNISIEQLRRKIPDARLISDNITSDMFKYEDSVIVFMGAGDVQKYMDVLLQQ